MIEMTTFAARLFPQREGFGITGDVPTRDNNPGDLRHAPGAMHSPGDPDGIAKFATVEDGWSALDRQLALYASRGMTVQQAVYVFAPPSENDSAASLDFICKGLGCFPTTPMSTVLKLGDTSWQTNQVQPPAAGSPPISSLGAPSSVKPPPKSLWQSVTSILKPRSPPSLPQQSPPSATPSVPISSPTKVNDMSTPNPILVAAAPVLIQAIQDLQTAINT